MDSQLAPERGPLLDVIDLLLILPVAASQSLVVFVVSVLIFVIRRWPRMCAGFLQLVGVRVVRPWHCKVLPGAAAYLEAESVKNNESVILPDPAPPTADQQTDRADRPSVSADNLEVPRLQLDRTKVAIIEVLVYNGWQVGEIRSALKGDNGTISAEVEAAKKRLGIVDEPRHLRVKDEKGERLIPMEAP